METSSPFTVKTVPSPTWQTSHKPEPAKRVVLPNGKGLPCENKNVLLRKRNKKKGNCFFILNLLKFLNSELIYNSKINDYFWKHTKIKSYKNTHNLIGGKDRIDITL